MRPCAPRKCRVGLASGEVATRIFPSLQRGLLSWTKAWRFVLPAGVAIGAVFGSAPADACVVVSGFFVDAGGAETPNVCENIWWNGKSGAAALFDYQFFVASGGPASIDFFGFGVAPAPVALASSNLGPTFFPNSNFTGVLPVTAQANGVFTSNGAPAGWDFDEYTGLLSYFVDWNDIGVGTLPGNPALTVNNNPGSIAALDGSFGVFNAFSPFGPVAGFGVVDPPSSDIFIMLEFGDPTASGIVNLQEIIPVAGTTIGPSAFCTAPGQTIAGESPCTDPNGDPVGPPTVVPEPTSFGLFAAALGALSLLRRRKPRLKRC